MIIDTRLIEPLEGIQGNLCQVIGEVENGKISNEFVLKARVFRRVDDLDLVLYEKALMKQREFLKT